MSDMTLPVFVLNDDSIESKTNMAARAATAWISERIWFEEFKPDDDLPFPEGHATFTEGEAEWIAKPGNITAFEINGERDIATIEDRGLSLGMFAGADWFYIRNENAKVLAIGFVPLPLNTVERLAKGFSSL